MYVTKLFFLFMCHIFSLNKQGTDIVVVVGMLHCNGVARWLLSGEDPLQPDEL